jgi:cytochrome c oxidase subunit 2
MLDRLILSGSSFAPDIDNLFFLVTVLVGFWFVVAQLLLFYFVFRFRQRPGVKASYITGETARQFAWILVPLILVVACDGWIDVATARVWHTIKEELPPADDLIRVTGQQWAWTFRHAGPDGKLDTADDVVTVDQLHVQTGVVTQFELESRDVLHSFCVPIFRLKQDAIPGRKIRGWFKPTVKGEYDVQCTEICGIGHALMASRIFIETPEEHAKFLKPPKPAEGGAPKSEFE